MARISKKSGFVLEILLFPLAVLILILIAVRLYMDFPREVDPSAVFGTYTANYDTLECTLILNEDGTYDYCLETNGGEKYVNSDYWEIRDTELGQYILFYDFKYHYDPFPLPRAKIKEGPFYLDLPIHADYRGRVKITINGDFGFYFSKQKTSSAVSAPPLAVFPDAHSSHPGLDPGSIISQAS